MVPGRFWVGGGWRLVAERRQQAGQDQRAGDAGQARTKPAEQRRADLLESPDPDRCSVH